MQAPYHPIRLLISLVSQSPALLWLTSPGAHGGAWGSGIEGWCETNLRATRLGDIFLLLTEERNQYTDDSRQSNYSRYNERSPSSSLL